VLTVHEAAGEAVAKLRRGEGPYLLECMTYRMAGHYVGDAQHYRSADELAAMREKDPIERLERHLLEHGVSQGELEAIGEGAKQEVQQAVERARAAPRPAPATVGEYVYSAPSLAAIPG
jgi:TPP-dependent pyruvate/acetoin dehydrogenase alpha subunit